MCWGTPGRFFEETRVSLEEEDVENEVEREGAKVEEGREETPILQFVSTCAIM